jgi:DNA-binding MarR family transcriptional regulator
VTAAEQVDGHPACSGGPFSTADAAFRRIGLTCRTAADGRRAVRALSEWAQRFALSEPEFQVLWCLRSPLNDGRDQTGLAASVACSPAQISATVERLRAKGWIVQRQKPGDRRRHVWQLSAEGATLFGEMLLAVGHLRDVEASVDPCGGKSDFPREAAA